MIGFSSVGNFLKNLKYGKVSGIIDDIKNIDIEMKFNSLFKIIGKYGKIIEEIEKDIAILKKDSHPSIFTIDE